MENAMDCREVEHIIWTDGPEAASAEHLLECRACREESRRAADLQAALTGMRNRFALPPDELEHLILDAVSRTRLGRARDIVADITARPKFWRGAAVGAAAAAGLTGAAIGVIAARRRVAARPEVA
jgi:predicted anti-sigma-YlaC factor YlaD